LATQFTKELEELASFYNRVFGEASKWDMIWTTLLKI
jgi:hypothetical protein